MWLILTPHQQRKVFHSCIAGSNINWLTNQQNTKPKFFLSLCQFKDKAFQSVYHKHCETFPPSSHFPAKGGGEAATAGLSVERRRRQFLSSSCATRGGSGPGTGPGPAAGREPCKSRLWTKVGSQGQGSVLGHGLDLDSIELTQAPPACLPTGSLAARGPDLECQSFVLWWLEVTWRWNKCWEQTRGETSWVSCTCAGCTTWWRRSSPTLTLARSPLAIRFKSCQQRSLGRGVSWYIYVKNKAWVALSCVRCGHRILLNVQLWSQRIRTQEIIEESLADLLLPVRVPLYFWIMTKKGKPVF